MASRLAGIVAALGAFAMAVAGCASTTPGNVATAPRDAASIPGYIAPTPQLALDPATPCPHSLGRAKDVKNRGEGLSHRLVPPDVPRGGLVCVYRRPTTVQTARDAPRLVRQVGLSVAEAIAMARDLPLVSLDPLRATWSCPGGPGRVIIVGFAYAHRPAVSLWYADSGCRTLDNGHVRAEEVGHQSFYDHFAKRVEALLQ